MNSKEIRLFKRLKNIKNSMLFLLAWLSFQNRFQFYLLVDNYPYFIFNPILKTSNIIFHRLICDSVQNYLYVFITSLLKKFSKRNWLILWSLKESIPIQLDDEICWLLKHLFLLILISPILIGTTLIAFFRNCEPISCNPLLLFLTC